MKKYCLHLMGLDHYVRKNAINSDVLKDIELFAKKLKVTLRIQNNAIVIGSHRMSAQQLIRGAGKKQVFNWIMEKYGE